MWNKQRIGKIIAELVETHFQVSAQDTQLPVNEPPSDFEGDYSIVLFPLVKKSGQTPDSIGNILGNSLLERKEILSFNIVKGFLNVVLPDQVWKENLEEISNAGEQFGSGTPESNLYMVEYGSPNTNKPLHLGHLRNILIGQSLANIYKKAGVKVITTQIFNNRGIAICKSMLAWQRYGGGKTPESEEMKSDHFVGYYYVLFNTKLKEEYSTWQHTDLANEIFSAKAKPNQSREEFFKEYSQEYGREHSQWSKDALNLLNQYEAGDPEAVALWEMMNVWAIQGVQKTFSRLDVHFDKDYFESDTYLLGRDVVLQGLKNGSFYQKPDSSIWVDLTEFKLDHKLLLRSDGTSIYITQDLGTVQLRYDAYHFNKCVYVVGDEQRYHFDALFAIAKMFKAPYANDLYHMAHGMVELPDGKMKSREGTVVDADDLMDEVIRLAAKNAEERGETSLLSKQEQEEIHEMIGMSALKYFILKVHPQKRMVFDPKESVDMQGATGPYIQNAYVRAKSIFRKAPAIDISKSKNYLQLHPLEKQLIRQITEFPSLIRTAAESMDPSIIAHYIYQLAKNYHKMYHELSVLQAEEHAMHFRLLLSQCVSQQLKSSAALLGIRMPERM